MHKLMEYVCDELEELERKVEKGGKLSMAEMQYVDTLAHTKKNLLKADEMSGEYSMDDGTYARNTYARADRRMSRGYEDGRSYARRRDSMGRYSSTGYSMAADDMVDELRDLMRDAPDEQTRMEFQKFINKIEKM